VFFFVRALKFYESLIHEDLSALESDDDLRELLTEDVKKEFGLEKQKNQTIKTREWLESELEKSGEDSFDCDISMSHGSVRFIRSVCLLYIKHLYVRRNKLSTKPNISTKTLEAVDTQISKLEELLNSGVFSEATPWPLLVDQLEVQQEPEQEDITSDYISHAKRPKPVFVNSIEILDSELKKRCLDLFNHFEETSQPERHDTVVTEATRILENRLRLLTKTSGSESGAELAVKAFAGKEPMFIVSDIQSEQDAAHLLFRGAFGYIRNRAHHKLLSDLSAERVLQILGFIDYLISVAESAKYNENKG
jgi:uncharacterized protein (TIGR02391 family)